MEQIKCLLGLIIVLISLIDGNPTNNEVILKRTRRIIRGQLAKPGQVFFSRMINEKVKHHCTISFPIKSRSIIMEIIFVVELSYMKSGY